MPLLFVYCKQKSLRYTFRLIFQVEKQILLTKKAFSISRASYLRWKNRYLRLNRRQIYITPHILGKKTGICDQPNLGYIFRLIFQIGKWVYTTKQASNICSALYFEQKTRYLQPAKPQVQIVGNILGEKLVTYN